MTKENPIAIALFGRICSGKTTLAKKFENNYGFEVVSKDRCILKSELLKRENKDVSWEKVRSNCVETIIRKNKNAVIDETIRIDRLSAFKDAGYTIIGIKLNTNFKKCKQRLYNRNKRRKEILVELSNIIGLDVTIMPQEHRRNLWSSKNFIETIPQSQIETFDNLIEEIYTLGCDYLKEEDPNPACFPELDFVVELEDDFNIDFFELDTIDDKKIVFEDYLKTYLSTIKYCVWDIGGVVYKFSLDALNAWCRQKSKVSVNIKTFDFDEYMMGNISFHQLCRNICKFCDINYYEEYDAEIESALWEGVSDDFEITHDLMKIIESKGMENCILSNALPILLDSGKYHELVKQEYRFYSFDLHMLKPENDIYIRIKDKLQCKFHDIAFIDDKLENINAAIELGIYAILYDSNTVHNLLFTV